MMKTIAYFDCPTGLSGDMILAALINAGASFDIIHDNLKKLPIKNWNIRHNQIVKNGLTALKVDITYNEDNIHRNLPEIKKIILQADLPKRVTDFAITTFHHLAEAEAKIHGVPIDEVHFHEVGAIDTILDITGVAIALDILEIDHVYSRALPLAHGQINCQHGIINLPAPATLELLHGMQLAPCELKGELITPTGAAILKSLLPINGFAPPPFTLKKHGRGAGKRDLPIANILRIYIGEADLNEDTIDVLNTVIDDINPEILGYFWQKAFSMGALDLYYTPVTMKKGRPGWEITLLVPQGEAQYFADLLFSETTTLGIRIRQEKRMLLERSFFEVDTDFGQIIIKKAGSGKSATISPEYQSCLNAAIKYHAPLKTVYQAAVSAAYKDAIYQK